MKIMKIGKSLLCVMAIACGAVCLSLNGLVVAHAEPSTDICSVDGVSYRYFNEALRNWKQGTTMTLLSDLSLSGLEGSRGPLNLESISVAEDKTLDLNGKTIRGTGTSSVLLVSGAELTINDSSAAKSGKITGGDSSFGGGIYASNATVKFNGGTITGNNARNGGGIHGWDSRIVLNGGAVKENTAEFGGGIYLIGGSLEFAGQSAVEGNTAEANGGGIYAYASSSTSALIDLKQGSVSGNSASFGGGIAVWEGARLDLSGTASVSENKATGGAGVYVFGDTEDEAEIKTALFTMTGGEIVSNIGTSGFGGGVKVSNGGIFRISGGLIGENTTEVHGGGVSVEFGGKAEFGGSAQIANNLRGDSKDNVFFADGSDLTVNDDFAGTVGFNRPTYGTLSKDYMGEMDGLTADDPDFEVYFENGNIYIGSNVATSLVIESSPTKMTYDLGEKPDLTGMVVKVVYKDGRVAEVTGYTFDGSPFTADNTTREISYQIGDVTLKATLKFSLNGVTTEEEDSGSPFGFIAIVTLSCLFVVSFIVVAFVTHGFGGKKKKKEE